MPEQLVDGDGRAPSGALPPIPSSGDAALLVVESLIHHLVSRSILSVQDAIEIIDVAAEVEREITLAASQGPPSRDAATILSSMAKSLRLDLTIDPGP